MHCMNIDYWRSGDLQYESLQWRDLQQLTESIISMQALEKKLKEQIIPAYVRWILMLSYRNLLVDFVLGKGISRMYKVNKNRFQS